MPWRSRCLDCERCKACSARHSRWPTMKGGYTIMLDVGANVEADAEQLVEFAIMGEAFARAVSDEPRPKVALLNVGAEDQKGHEEIRSAAKLIRETDVDINFRLRCGRRYRQGHRRCRRNRRFYRQYRAQNWRRHCASRRAIAARGANQRTFGAAWCVDCVSCFTKASHAHGSGHV